MKGIRLSRGQTEVLVEMQIANQQSPGYALSTPHLSRRLDKRFDDWARDKLKRLAEHGLVVRAGESFGHAHCWRLTEAGRQFTPSTPHPGAEA